MLLTALPVLLGLHWAAPQFPPGPLGPLPPAPSSHSFRYKAGVDSIAPAVAVEEEEPARTLVAAVEEEDTAVCTLGPASGRPEVEPHVFLWNRRPVALCGPASGRPEVEPHVFLWNRSPVTLCGPPRGF